MAHFLQATGDRFKDGRYYDTVTMNTKQSDDDFACIVFRKRFNAQPHILTRQPAEFEIRNIKLDSIARRGFK